MIKYELILLSFLLQCIYTVKCFHTVDISFSHNKIRVPVDITININSSWNLEVNELITISLPRFTRNHNGLRTSTEDFNLALGHIIVSPSIMFKAGWSEGNFPLDYDFNATNFNNTPYRHSELLLFPQYDMVKKDIMTTITIDKINGIGTYCGFSSSQTLQEASSTSPSPHFMIETNFSEIRNRHIDRPNVTHRIDTWNSMGVGCIGKNNCTGHGACNWCYEVCECFESYGAYTDIVTIGRDLDGTCAQRVCPAGKAIADVPSGPNTAHKLAECSNRGKCDRETGECICSPPYTGSACERLGCPNDCSGHGRCMSMYEMAQQQRMANPLLPYDYGTLLGYDLWSWDYDVMYGCVCDAPWVVGFNYGETQLAEYFGPDCSLRHCPSGDNPYSSQNELNCRGKNQVLPPGSNINTAIVGSVGNFCHIDCSDRGLCNYNDGTCKCFEGSWGSDCGQVSNAGGKQSNYDFPSHLNYSTAHVVEGN